SDGVASASSIFNLSDYNLANPSLSRQLDPIRTDVPGGVPFGLASLFGALYVSDGNQETITRITPDGQAARVVQYPASNRVLTGLSAGPNGSLSIAEFGPAPHRENSARITRWSPNGEFATAEAGFTAAIDVAFDAEGVMYVLEFSEPGVRIPNTGRVVR